MSSQSAGVGRRAGGAPRFRARWRAGGVQPCPARQPERDGVQPVRDRPVAVERPGLVDENEERGLEGVLGGVRVAQHAAADAEHEPPVPADEYLERRLVAVLDEPGEQLAVRRAVVRFRRPGS